MPSLVWYEQDKKVYNFTVEFAYELVCAGVWVCFCFLPSLYSFLF